MPGGMPPGMQARGPRLAFSSPRAVLLRNGALHCPGAAPFCFFQARRNCRPICKGLSMPLKQLSPPSAEPVSLADAKAHLRVDGSSEDAIITSLIVTSRLHIEAALGLALLSQAWCLVFDRWPRSGEVTLPLRPLQSVNEVRILEADGQHRVVEASRYVTDAVSAPGRIVAEGGGWPAPGRAANGIEIDFTAGYGDDAGDVPAPIRQALLMLVAHWYEHRDPIEIGTPGVAIPAGVSRLLKPYRVGRL